MGNTEDTELTASALYGCAVEFLEGRRLIIVNTIKALSPYTIRYPFTVRTGRVKSYPQEFPDLLPMHTACMSVFRIKRK